MGKLFIAALDDPEDDPFGLPTPRDQARSAMRNLDLIYCCANCHTHLARRRHLLSSNFRGRTGTALLLDSVVNVVFGPQEDTIMTTGMHSIRVCFCVNCLENIGWTYEEAFEDDQKYKEHRFILEEHLIDLWNPSEAGPSEERERRRAARNLNPEPAASPASST
ncbi:Protein yippee-like 5 [Perkinsus chesapeaki]|uniref:Protein yippee-like n=1 Tax=Perkinsus chesapeaki TaxID=330153 RepID=A0A7J6LNC4_PERCH|nr:Protein yippee-like 5 [Perkinsus chesapeaki]